MGMHSLLPTEPPTFSLTLIRTEEKNKSVIFYLIIGAPSTSNDSVEAPFAICTNDNRILSFKISGTEENPKVEIISYDSDDGSVSQTFGISYIPRVTSVVCNDNYLAITDVLGFVHIYKYSHSLPVWAIILIVVGSLLIVGAIVGFIIYKRRQSKKQGSYQQFNNEEKSGNGL